MVVITQIDEEKSIKKRKVERPDFPQQVEIVDLESGLFGFTPIKDKGTTKKNAISVEQYSEQRDLQLAVKVSTTTLDGNYIDLDNYDDDLFVLNFEPPKTPFGKKRGKWKKPLSDLSITDPAESSNSKANHVPSFICEICVEPKHANESFNIKGCSHAYCMDCMIKYVASKLQDKITAISCPVGNCEGLLEPEYCRNILPREVFDRWGEALCEAMILGSERFYCPFKDCSMLLIDDGGQVVMESECPNCRRLFCAQCKVPWHTGIECGEFQRLHKDEREREDIMLMKLAKEKKWARCPKCRFVVERTQGCRSMRCRCGTAFCYDCGITQVDSYYFCRYCNPGQCNIVPFFGTLLSHQNLTEFLCENECLGFYWGNWYKPKLSDGVADFEAMDDYLDQYFSSSSWSDVNVKDRSSWVHCEPDQPNALLPSSLGVYQDDKNINSSVSMISSNNSMECLAAQNTPVLVPNGESGCGVGHDLLSGEGGPQMDAENCSGNSSKEMLKGSLGFGNLGLQFNAPVHSSVLPGLDSSKDLPVVTPSLLFNERGHLICNGGESSEFRRSLTKVNLQGENGNVDNDVNINRFVEIDKILRPENLSTIINAKGKQDMQNSLYSSFPADRRITKSMIGLPSLLQSASPIPNSGCIGIGKPRVRARRGQATDPNSIAERLRREKIAERMKNMQELVPNSNKTNKASMLDEIIGYVKFLQLQVRVLSMSRLGAAGAVVPLINDGQAEGSNGLSLKPLAGQEFDFSPSPDQVVFEQEVVKLMESNVTMAMQYLQSKGLCLMPIALGAAISNGKASPSSLSPSGAVSNFLSEERKKFGFTNSLVNNDIVHNTCSSNCLFQNSNCSSSSSGSLPDVGIHHMTSDGNFMTGKISAGLMANGCNGTFKQEEVNTLCTAK
ncbi:hypothetical protein CRYUN_Cryun26dG0039100 [Craigia yunnanensis]